MSDGCGCVIIKVSKNTVRLAGSLICVPQVPLTMQVYAPSSEVETDEIFKTERFVPEILASSLISTPPFCH